MSRTFLSVILSIVKVNQRVVLLSWGTKIPNVSGFRGKQPSKLGPEAIYCKVTCCEQRRREGAKVGLEIKETGERGGD